MALLTPESVYRLHETMGVPESGKHKPKKAEIIQLLNQLFGTSRGGWVVTRTLIELNGVTPESETDGGVVLTGAGAGYYDRDDGDWVFGRGFPDTFARVDLDGSGTVQTGIVNAGVNPATTEVFFARVETPNTGALTLSIDGELARPVINLAGNLLSPGEWTGMVMFHLNDDGDYQLLLDAGAAASAAASATSAGLDADRAEEAASEASAYADFARNNWAIAAFGMGTGEEEDIPLLVDPGSVNNMLVVISGVVQLVTQDAYSLVYDAGDSFVRMTVPLDVPYEVKVGNAVDIGTPSEGSVTEPKIANGAATEAKIGTGAVTATKLGTGSVTEPKLGALSVSTAKLQDLAATKAKIASSAIDASKIDGADAAAILAALGVTAPAAYTPTVTGFGTPTGVAATWWRVGKVLHVVGQLVSGTPSATEARFSLPSGITASVPVRMVVGQGAFSTATPNLLTVMAEPGVAYATFGAQGASSAGTAKLQGSGIANPGMALSFFASIPVS